MCFVDICMSSLEKCLLELLPIFQLVWFFTLSCKSCLYILQINPLSDASFANIYSHSEGYFLCLVYDFLCYAKVLSLIRSHLFIFVSILIIPGGASKKDLVVLCAKSVLSVFL